jgi:hypothetical protein
MPTAATLGTARLESTWRKLSAVEDLDLDFDLEDLACSLALRVPPQLPQDQHVSHRLEIATVQTV